VLNTKTIFVRVTLRVNLHAVIAHWQTFGTLNLTTHFYSPCYILSFTVLHFHYSFYLFNNVKVFNRIKQMQWLEIIAPDTLYWVRSQPASEATLTSCLTCMPAIISIGRDSVGTFQQLIKHLCGAPWCMYWVAHSLSDPLLMGSNPSTAIHMQCTCLQQAEITGVVLNGRFSSLPAVVHSTSYPPGIASSSVPVVVLRG